MTPFLAYFSQKLLKLGKANCRRFLWLVPRLRMGLTCLTDQNAVTGINFIIPCFKVLNGKVYQNKIGSHGAKFSTLKYCSHSEYASKLSIGAWAFCHFFCRSNFRSSHMVTPSAARLSCSQANCSSFDLLVSLFAL